MQCSVRFIFFYYIYVLNICVCSCAHYYKYMISKHIWRTQGYLNVCAMHTFTNAHLKVCNAQICTQSVCSINH